MALLSGWWVAALALSVGVLFWFSDRMWPDAWLPRLEIPALLRASRVTLFLTAVSMPIAVALGLFLAVCRRSQYALFSWPTALYIEAIRGTPLLVQLFVIFYSLPQLGLYFETDLLTLDGMTVAVICLSGNYAAYEAEIHRAGLQAVESGQREAALSLGLSERQSFFSVVLPQAFRIILPPVLNDAIAMLKDCSLVTTITVSELLNVAEGIGRTRINRSQVLLAAAAIYLLMSMTFLLFGKWVEKRLAFSGKPKLNVENLKH